MIRGPAEFLFQGMTKTTIPRPRWAAVAALVAVVFGVVTIIVGGKTLFGGPAERAAAGNIVPLGYPMDAFTLA